MKFKDFWELCKPRILVAFTCLFIFSYLISCKGKIQLKSVTQGLIGTVLSIGGANALNNYWDRDIDAKMARTMRRAIPSGRVKPDIALGFALILSTMALIVSIYLGLVPFVLFLIGFMSYILFYTVLTKRRFALSIFSTFPAVSSVAWFGWFMGTGSISLKGFLTGLLIALWGPVHFWSLALAYSRDYKKVGVPVLPVIVGFKKGKWHLLVSSLLIISATYVLYILEFYGTIYLLVTSIFNVVLIWLNILFLLKPNSRSSWRIYKFTPTYILGVFLAMLLDQL